MTNEVNNEDKLVEEWTSFVKPLSNKKKLEPVTEEIQQSCVEAITKDVSYSLMRDVHNNQHSKLDKSFRKVNSTSNNI